MCVVPNEVQVLRASLFPTVGFGQPIMYVIIFCYTYWTNSSLLSRVFLFNLNNWYQSRAGRRRNRSSVPGRDKPVATLRNVQTRSYSLIFRRCLMLFPSAYSRVLTSSQCRTEQCMAPSLSTTHARTNAHTFMTCTATTWYIHYGSYRTANLQMLHFIYLFNKYTYWIF